MTDRQQKLEISAEDFAVIEAALHTQSKILHVQATAGGKDANTRLNQVKRTLSTLAQQKPVENDRPPCPPVRWFGMSRIFG